MTRQIKHELQRAKKMHPVWPDDIIHQTAIMAEEAGEALQATLNFVYHGGSYKKMQQEIIHTGAMVLRWLENNK